MTALAGHEVPERNPPVISGNSKHGSASIELSYECLASGVQYPVIMLEEVLIHDSSLPLGGHLIFNNYN